jgi:hypothetical protein
MSRQLLESLVKLERNDDTFVMKIYDFLFIIWM